MDLWRISPHVDLSGRGGLLVDGRWHQRGVPVVYCCDHPSTALLEVLVHMDRSRIPPRYQLLRIDCPDDLQMLTPSNIPKQAADLDVSRSIGTALLRDRRHPLIRVPSAVMPAAWNILINPMHSGSARITVAETFQYPWDSLILR
ncbi:RES domain-containing protein [Hoeflea marina]|uniref:RES domain-containing protein n=1 Tax=Hoeflea marina TaxID=274592 RepID=A0A317PMW0_9HYPH|nr:RES family NAD+ phosphorylase [Hoeflea marina]PWW01599.1 RES domain-containing protein [Hoeflea marina]